MMTLKNKFEDLILYCHDSRIATDVGCQTRVYIESGCATRENLHVFQQILGNYTDS